MSISGVRQIVANNILRATLRAQIITFMAYISTSLYLAGWRDSLIWGITGDRHGAGSGGFDDLVARVFLDGEQAFIAEFPRHVFGYLEFVARRIKQEYGFRSHGVQVMNHQRHRLALLSNA